MGTLPPCEDAPCVDASGPGQGGGSIARRESVTWPLVLGREGPPRRCIYLQGYRIPTEGSQSQRFLHLCPSDIRLLLHIQTSGNVLSRNERNLVLSFVCLLGFDDDDDDDDDDEGSTTTCFL